MVSRLIGTLIGLGTAAVIAFFVWFFWDWFVWAWNLLFGGDDVEDKRITKRTDCENTIEEMTLCDGEPPDCQSKYDALTNSFTQKQTETINGELDENAIQLYCSTVYIGLLRTYYECLCSCPKCSKDPCEEKEVDLGEECFNSLVDLIPDEE